MAVAHAGLSEKTLMAQLKRLKFLRGFEESKDELLRALWNNSHSDGHAERVITRVIDTRRPNKEGFVSCPTPAELADYCAEVPSNAGGIKAPDKKCKLCADNPGWKVITRDGKSGVDRCPCTKVGA